MTIEVHNINDNALSMWAACHFIALRYLCFYKIIKLVSLFYKILIPHRKEFLKLTYSVIEIW